MGEDLNLPRDYLPERKRKIVFIEQLQTVMIGQRFDN